MNNQTLKLVFLSIILFCFSAVTNGQFIAKFNFSNGEKKVIDSIKEIKEINARIKKIITEKDPEDLSGVLNMMKKSKVMQVFQKSSEIKNRWKKDSSFKLLLNDTIPLKPTKKDNIIQTDTTVSDSDTLSTNEENNCKKVEVIVGLKNEKLGDGNYQFTLFDSDENPVKSFVLKQYNESLFRDKLTNAFHSLCSSSSNAIDSANIKSKVADLIDKQKLYDRMMEASLEVDNSKDLAGELTIRKHIKVYTETRISNKETALNKEFSSKVPFLFNGSTETAYNPDLHSQNIKANNGGFIKAEANVAESDVAYYGRKIWPFKKKQTIITESDFTVHQFQIQFQDGFIENVQIFGKIKGDPHLLQFSNFYPIRFSTKFDFSKLKGKLLYEKTVYAKKDIYIDLGEIITYSPNLALDTKDYSPENQVWPESLTSNITQNLTNVNLYKEQTSKILEAKIFTDLKGIDGENPNGLVQLELSKKLNLLSWRAPFIKGLGYRTNNVGLFNFIVPTFSMNKIESNQKRLPLSHFDTVSSISPDTNRALNYTSTINLLKHQIFHVGFDLSVLTLDFTTLKSVVNIGYGLYFGRSALQDTLRTKSISPNGRPKFTAASTNNVDDFNVNTFQMGPFVSWQIYPNRKYGFSMMQRLTYFNALSERFIQVRDSSHYVNYITAPGNQDTSNVYKASYNYAQGWKRIIGVAELFAFFRPSDNTKIFFRYRLNWDWHNSKENFHQMQVGISTTLTTTKESGAKGAKPQQL